MKNSKVSLNTNSNPHLNSSNNNLNSFNNYVNNEPNSRLLVENNNNNSIGNLSFSNSSKRRRSSSSSTKSVKTRQFIFKWFSAQKLFKKIQQSCVVINFIITILLLAACLVINIEKHFQVITHLGNELSYTSLNRIIGILPLVLSMIVGVAIILDSSQIVLYFYIRRFLRIHDTRRINNILRNQVKLDRFTFDNSKQENKCLETRRQLKYRSQVVLTTMSSLVFLTFIAYAIFIIGPLTFIGVFLILKMDHMLSYELPQTLLKLFKLYEQQQLEILRNEDRIFGVIYANHIVSTIEEDVINKMHQRFRCCHFYNPYQFGDLAPDSCHFDVGCVNPLQEFSWHYIYLGSIFLLSCVAVKINMQILLWINFKVLFANKLIKKLYFYKIASKKNEKPLIEKPIYKMYQRESLLRQQEPKSIIEINGSIGSLFCEDKEVAKKKLQEIRRLKELKLQQEDEEEERQRIRDEQELARRKDLERRQLEYERKLERENRLDELKFERLQRAANTNSEIDF
jgi:hypothetical protein